jgi:hypothetical protein
LCDGAHSEEKERAAKHEKPERDATRDDMHHVPDLYPMINGSKRVLGNSIALDG